VCAQHQIGVIPYFALAAGFLTGKYRSEKDLAASRRSSMAKKDLNERGIRILAALDEVAKDRHATPGEIALAWLMARPSITAPIASATTEDQLRSLVRATEIQLDSASIEKLNRASAYDR